jgi:hypothetical protein
LEKKKKQTALLFAKAYKVVFAAFFAGGVGFGHCDLEEVLLELPT